MWSSFVHAANWFALKGEGYNFWSGIGSDLGEVTLVAMAAGWWHHVNCHEQGCWRKGHPNSDGKVICKKHLAGGSDAESRAGE